ncbi:MAG: GTPase domain-containing protein [Labilithrix sp.]|nr:GTPase domain-containing protein [Labilithrix sp.]
MASVNPHTRELVFKLVFYGPGLGGKTTTLQYIHAATKPEHRGKMVSLATPTDRTLYFDFLPIRVPRVRGMAVRLQLFTVPGQVYYAATRKLVLSGADGIVFVADSQSGRVEVNQESLDDLHANLGEHNRSLDEVPHTFHWNKRDLGELLPLEELDRRFNHHGAPSLGTVATKGEGVFEGLERITRLVLKAYEKDPKVRIEPTSDGAKDGDAPLEAEGIAQALRQMESAGAEASAASVEAPTKISAVVPDTGQGAPAVGSARASDKPASDRVEGAKSAKPKSDGPSPAAGPKSDGPSPAAGSGGIVAKDSGAWTRFTIPEPSGPAPEAPPAAVQSADVPPVAAGFSLAELWPEAERDRVRQAEAMLAARDAVNAILACDVLVTRVLASAAGLVGTLDAPRDPALVSLLLGLDGARYLQFRTVVRAARHREAVTLRDAFECFTFSIEARRAREALRR